MNIRVDLNTPINDGTEVVFRSPVDCSQITGLIVYYREDGKTSSKEFALADAHGNNVGDIDHLFAENVVVKVILDVTSGMAFVQNADTNAYIEKTFIKTVNGIGPDENGNVVVEGGGGGNVDLTGYATEEWVREGYQPKGEYLTEHQDISGKLDASALPTAINTALAQAKASGEFKGEPGQPGEPGKDYTLTEADKQEISELTAPLVDVPQGGGGDENIIPTETVLAEGVVATGAGSWSRTDTGVTIATMNQYKRIRLAIKGASNKANYWCFQFTTQHASEVKRIASNSGMAITFEKISDNYFRIQSIAANGNTDTILKGIIVTSESWINGGKGSPSPYILNFTPYGENATLKIAPASATEIDYSWCICGYNC